MTLGRRIAANTLAQVIGRGFSFVLNAVEIIAITRYLGVDQFGQYVFITSFTLLFAALGDFGVSKVAVREIAKTEHDAGRILATSVAVRLALSLIAFVLCAATINLMGYPEGTRTGVYVASAVFVIAALQSLDAMFQAKLAMHYSALIQLLARIVDTALVLWLVATGAGLLAFLAVPVLSGAVSLLLIALTVLRKYRPRLEVDWSGFWPMLVEAMPIGLSFFLALIYLKTDAVLLSSIVGPQAAGIYGAAYKPVEYLLVVVAGLFIFSVFPALSQLYGTDMRAFRTLYRRSLEVLMMVIMPLAVAVTVLADPLVELVFSRGYAASAAPLRILMWAAVFMFASAYLSFVLIAMHRQRATLLNDAVGAAANVTLNLLLIPIWNVVGSAVAILLTAVVVPAMAHEAIRRQTGLVADFGTLGRILAASLVMGAAMFLVGQVQWVLGAVAGALCYPPLLIAFRGVSTRDIGALMARRVAVTVE